MGFSSARFFGYGFMNNAPWRRCNFTYISIIAARLGRLNRWSWWRIWMLISIDSGLSRRRRRLRLGGQWWRCSPPEGLFGSGTLRLVALRLR
jgi:hypothetical protein